MKKYNMIIRIAGLNDRLCNDEVVFTVNDNDHVNDIANALKTAHTYLDSDKNGYETQGRNTVTLLNHVCNQHDRWSWHWFAMDGQITLPANGHW